MNLKKLHEILNYDSSISAKILLGAEEGKKELLKEIKQDLKNVHMINMKLYIDNKLKEI